MALNIALPCPGIGELFDGSGMLSPISSPTSPIDLGFPHVYKSLASPDTESSSGVSSFDSDEAKVNISIICFSYLTYLLI